MHLKAPALGRNDTRTAGGHNRLAAYAARLPQRPVPTRMAGPQPVYAKTVGTFVPRLTKPAFERYGFSAAALITDWETIIGADIARYTMPERLKWPKRVDWSADEAAEENRGRPGATLVLAVAAGRALDIQYKASQLLERINAYFGYRAIADLRIVQVTAIKPASAIPSVPLAATKSVTPPQPREELAAIAEPGLKAALERMAQGLVARSARPRAKA